MNDKEFAPCRQTLIQALDQESFRSKSALRARGASAQPCAAKDVITIEPKSVGLRPQPGLSVCLLLYAFCEFY